MCDDIYIPKTLEDFKNIRKTILELMTNPYCDQTMYLDLVKKLYNTNEKIAELEKEEN